MSKMESDLTSYDQNTDLELKKIEYDPNGMPNSQRAKRSPIRGVDGEASRSE